MLQRVKRILARNRRRRAFRKLNTLCVELHEGYENRCYDFAENGEQFILQRLAEHGTMRVVFDVGANLGEWSRIASDCFSDAEIHAFEIVPKTAEVLRLKFKDSGRIHVNSVGLGDKDGAGIVYVQGENSPLATCVSGFSEQFHHMQGVATTTQTMTGDRFCKTRGITRIDLLKIDVEGYEDKVLKGFSDMLASGAVRLIQFEYGYVNIASKFLLKDFYDYLAPHGMVIGKIYPNYVDFRKYRYEHEDFVGPNYLAVHESEAELIRKLGQ